MISIQTIKNVFKRKSKKQNQQGRAASQEFTIIDQKTMEEVEREYWQSDQSQIQPRQTIYKAPEQFEQIDQIQPEMEYLEYEVLDDDSLFGVSLKFNICPQEIMFINNLSSEMIFPGQKIKIPSSNLPRLSLIRVSSVGVKKNVNIWQQDSPKYHKFLMYYCIDNKNIKGVLSLTPDVIFFDPDQEDLSLSLSRSGSEQSNKPDKKEKKIRYHFCISMADMNEAVYFVLQNHTGNKDYVVQILLSGIGKKKLEQKYCKQLQRMKSQKKSIATIFLRHQERDQNDNLFAEEVKKENCIIVSQYISEICATYQQVGDNLTKIPYFDIIESNNEKFMNKMQEELPQLENLIGQRMDKIWASIDYVPVLSEESNCLNETMYKQIIERIPAVYRLAKWYIRYDTTEEGSSFENMLKDLKYQSPVIFVIKDVNQIVFGAYITSDIHYSHTFYGNGESFLFNFDNNKICVYESTQKNNDFVFCDRDGIAFGCGDKFGLFINNKLSKGYCNPCDTFDNPRFTLEENFIVKFIEVWTIQLD
ncbi:hypothetical protein pb186bvf_013398 [Paramecium bursaria]